MSGIKGKNTKPELLIRKGLHRLGFRYSLHKKNLPGKPDLVFAKYNALIFIHGCFWHVHKCQLFKMPSSNKEFWTRKLEKNVEVDGRNLWSLQNQGWRICIIWECALRGTNRRAAEAVLMECSDWLVSNNTYLEIKGLSNEKRLSVTIL